MKPSELERATTECEAENYEAARSLLIPLAEAGLAEAQCLLGNLFQLGLGVVADASQAAVWYERAAAQGSALASNNLWCLYRTALRSLDPDEQKARHWYEEARRLGFPHLPQEFY
ncbi:MAG: sel1 repeat family protein [Candidatus Binatia bacterium]